ncbi:MAG: ubiquinol-cytochrome C chaperone family protein [Rhodospirillales bacterium]|nr:ubiquinol-cytochrome C chaperone family protein [Rhodospirillales bacterium]
MRWFGAFRRKPHAAAAEDLYRAIVVQARQPAFYTACGVADTPDGRWDLISAHAALVLRRLRRQPQETRDLGQALFDLMFADMDQNLREMGVGDLAVGKRIKAMAKGFYGRLAAYDGALSSGDETALEAALRRNLYRKTDPRPAQVAMVAAYLRREAERLDAARLAELRAGRISFGVPPQPAEPLLA